MSTIWRQFHSQGYFLHRDKGWCREVSLGQNHERYRRVEVARRYLISVGRCRCATKIPASAIPLHVNGQSPPLTHETRRVPSVGVLLVGCKHLPLIPLSWMSTPLPPPPPPPPPAGGVAVAHCWVFVVPHYKHPLSISRVKQSK